MMEYINNNTKYGMKYNFKKIVSEFKKLKIPDKVYNPIYLPFERAKFFVLMSERALGKTTNIILLGMIFNKLYGTHIAYIRQREDMIAPKVTNDLFSVICNKEFNYIEILTDGKWTDVIYKNRRWYYCRYVENGDIEIDNDHFMIMLSIDNHNIYKSGLNEPKCDFLIFDEFIGEYYYPDEFIHFCDLFITIARKRLSPLIFMLSNTIDLYSPYFEELLIENDVHKMNINDSEIITTPKGTNIYVSIPGGEDYKTEEKSLFNRLFLGFNNPKLNAMTGSGWSINNYPHPPKSSKRELDDFAIEFHGVTIGIAIFNSKDVGYYAVCHKVTNINNKLIFVDRQIEKPNEIYAMKKSKIGRRLIDLYIDKKFYYVNNSIGNLVTNFFNSKGIFAGK